MEEVRTLETDELEELKVANTKKIIRLETAQDNFKNIVLKNLPNKFSYVDEWLEKKSKMLLEEATNFENGTRVRRPTFKKGTVIKVDFGVNPGSEMSQVHFAIVITKNDNPLLDQITVIPLTSKESEHRLSLDYDIFGNLIAEIEKHKRFLLIDQKFLKRQFLNKEISRATYNRKLNKLSSQLKMIDSNINYYQNHQKKSSLCINQITTIGKGKIKKPINDCDLLEKVRIPDAQLDIIDKEIINMYTNFNIAEYNEIK